MDPGNPIYVFISEVVRQILVGEEENKDRVEVFEKPIRVDSKQARTFLLSFRNLIGREFKPVE